MIADSRYPAQAFHDSFPGGRGAGELAVSALGFRFSGGGKVVSMPFAGAQLRLGGASDRLVFLAHPSCPGWSIYTSELAILKNPLLAAHPELTASIAQMRQRRVLAWAWIAAVFALLVAVPIVLALNLDGLSGIVARRVPVEWEKKLGEAAYAQFALGAKIMDESHAIALLTPVTRPLIREIPDARYEFRFHIVRDASLNAFALPGGEIVIHSGLILRAGSAEEFLGVLAHEVSHVTGQHGLRNIISSAGILITAQALIGDVGGLLGTIAAAAPLLLTMSYSRDFEREADLEGFELLQRAKINGQGMARFFEKVLAEEREARAKLKEQTSEETAATLEAAGKFLSSHPATQERIDRIRALADQQGGDFVDLNPQFLALQEQVQIFANAQAPATEAGSVPEEKNYEDGN